MYCSNCGAKLDDGQHFCTNCGHKLESESSAAPIEPVASGDEELVKGSNARPAGSAHAPVSAQAKQTRAYAPSQPAGLNPIPRGGRAAQTAPEAQPTPAQMAPATPVSRASFQNMSQAQQKSHRRASVAARVGVGIGAVALIASVGIVAYVGFARQPEEAPAAATVQAATTSAETEAATTEAATQAKTDSDEVTPQKDPRDYTLVELGKIANSIETKARDKNDAFDIARHYNLVDSSGKLTDASWGFDLQDEGLTNVRLVDIYHDKLAEGGYAAFTFMNLEPKYDSKINNTNSNAGGWKSSYIRSWINGDFKKNVHPDIAKYIKPVLKYTNNVGQTNSTNDVTATEDYFWIPSVVELTGPISWTWDSNPSQSNNFNAVLNAEGSQYLLFKQLHANPDDETQSALTIGVDYHLRSSSTSVNDHFRYVGATGDPSLFGDADVRRPIILSFCM